jgi:hypothetical protein
MFFLALFVSTQKLKTKQIVKVMSYLIQLLDIIKEKNVVLKKLLNLKK